MKKSMNVFTNNDLRVGMVLTCKNGNRYAVIADDNGHHDVINVTAGSKNCGCSNGVEVGTGRLAVCGGNSDGGRDVVKIQEFAAVPARNRLSEALKFMTGKRMTETLVTVWEKEDPRVTAAKKAVADAEAAADKANADLAAAKRKLANLI